MGQNREIDVNNDFVEHEEDSNVNEAPTLTKDEAIVQKYKMGMSVRDLAEAYNMAIGTVYSKLRRSKKVKIGISERSKYLDRIQNMSEQNKKQLIKDYQNFMTLQDIYKKYGINKHTCYAILDDAGVERRGKSVSSKFSFTEDKVYKVELPILYKDKEFKVTMELEAPIRIKVD